MSNVINLSVQISKLSQELVNARHDAEAKEKYWRDVKPEGIDPGDYTSDEFEANSLWNSWQDALDEVDDLEAEIEKLQNELDDLESQQDEREEY